MNYIENPNRVYNFILDNGERIPISTGDGVYTYSLDLSQKTEDIAVAVQARKGNGSVPKHFHNDCCELLMVILVNYEFGEGKTEYYIGIGGESDSHHWPDNVLLAISIKGKNFQSVNKYFDNLESVIELFDVINKLG